MMLADVKSFQENKQHTERRRRLLFKTSDPELPPFLRLCDYPANIRSNKNVISSKFSCWRLCDLATSSGEKTDCREQSQPAVAVAPLVLLNLRLSSCLCVFPGDDDDVEDEKPVVSPGR